MNDEVYEIKQIMRYNTFIDEKEKEAKSKTFLCGMYCLTATLNILLVAIKNAWQIRVLWAFCCVCNCINAYLNGKMAHDLINEKKELEEKRDSLLEKKPYELTRK